MSDCDYSHLLRLSVSPFTRVADPAMVGALDNANAWASLLPHYTQPIDVEILEPLEPLEVPGIDSNFASPAPRCTYDHETDACYKLVYLCKRPSDTSNPAPALAPALATSPALALATAPALATSPATSPATGSIGNDYNLLFASPAPVANNCHSRPHHPRLHHPCTHHSTQDPAYNSNSSGYYQNIIQTYMDEYKKLVDSVSKMINDIIKQSRQLSQIEISKLNEIMEQLLNLEIRIKKDLLKNIDDYFIVEPILKNNLKNFLIEQKIELAKLLNKIGNGFWTPVEIEIVSTNITNSVAVLNETVMSALTNPILRVLKKELELHIKIS